MRVPSLAFIFEISFSSQSGIPVLAMWPTLTLVPAIQFQGLYFQLCLLSEGFKKQCFNYLLPLQCRNLGPLYRETFQFLDYNFKTSRKFSFSCQISQYLNVGNYFFNIARGNKTKAQVVFLLQNLWTSRSLRRHCYPPSGHCFTAVGRVWRKFASCNADLESANTQSRHRGGWLRSLWGQGWCPCGPSHANSVLCFGKHGWACECGPGQPLSWLQRPHSWAVCHQEVLHSDLRPRAKQLW